ncbi:MAG: polyprenyl synthetase family protein, partial [Planctomycetota bacterium]
MAVPLLSSDCRNTSVDGGWVSDMINVRGGAGGESTRTYLHLLRGARRLFEPDELDRLLPRRRSDGDAEVKDATPLAATEAIAYDFLARGGKYSRPFITLAAHDAISGGDATTADGPDAVAGTPDAVRRVALAIEAFHKASLVHDDIQDNDDHRYGVPALHKQHGVATAINVGDYLIGLGYRMVAGDSVDLGPDAAADVLQKLAESHTRLCEGQGAELRWRDGDDKRIKPIDALQIYALKTSPAFEAAMYGGLRAAGPVDAPLTDATRELAKHVGVAFQILNDLKDWQGDDDNKLAAGGDVLSGRPTLLLALALEALDKEAADRLLTLVGSNGDADSSDAGIIEQVRVLYREAGVFDRAQRLVDRHQERAEQIADDLPSEPLRRLAYYLIDTVLERPAESTPQLVRMKILDAAANVEAANVEAAAAGPAQA